MSEVEKIDIESDYPIKPYNKKRKRRDLFALFFFCFNFFEKRFRKVWKVKENVLILQMSTGKSSFYDAYIE